MFFAKQILDVGPGTTAEALSHISLPDRVPADQPPRVREDDLVLYGDRPVVRAGLLELLSTEWLECTLMCASADEAIVALERSSQALMLDGGSMGATEVRETASERAIPTVLLLDGVAGHAHAELVRGSQAVLALRDVDAASVALALAAARRGLALLPGDVGPSLVATPSLVDCAGQDRLLQALALVASGLRDAEIAVRMSLSESAARKLVQRAVHRMGARTRGEAVAKAIRDGQLD
jgi:DNA-binding NarL/FixJ family response regulator